MEGKSSSQVHTAICTGGAVTVHQSVANNFSDERIWIWILFSKGILYEYEDNHHGVDHDPAAADHPNQQEVQG